MSKKTRILISCFLVVLAFGAGILAYAQAYGNRTEIVNAGSGGSEYFVDASHHIEKPVEPQAGATITEAEKAANRLTRGTADNPFFVLEIVPYDGMAEFGFHIAGCEPVDMAAMCRDGEQLSRESVFYTYKETYINAYWADEAPETYKSASNTQVMTTWQCGIMKYVGDGTGNYNRDEATVVDEYIPAEEGYPGPRYREEGGTYVLDAAGTLRRRIVDAEYVEATNGNYLWQPLTALECHNLNANSSEQQSYVTAYHDVLNPGDTFKMAFENVQYYVNYNARKIEHNNDFLKYSVGLAYEMVDGVRVERDPDEVKELIENYHSVVYTVTPEELNMNLHLIDRADLITVSSKTKLTIKTEQMTTYARDDLFKHLDTKVLNTSGATFVTNPLDWSAVLRIYERVTDPTRNCPIIFDVQTFDTVSVANKTVSFKLICESDSKVVSGVDATDNNMYKLIMLLMQMSNPTFEAFYGECNATTHAMFSEVAANTTAKKLNGDPIMTGAFEYTTESAYADSKVYWSWQTLIPWRVIEKVEMVDDNSYIPILDSYMIYKKIGVYQYGSEGMKSSVRNGVWMYLGNNELGSEFRSASTVGNNQYGGAVYDYIDSINGTAGEPSYVTAAECLYYMMNGLNGSPNAVNEEIYTILELQPSPDYRAQEEWDTLVATYTNTTKSPQIVQMTTSEFIGKNVECLSEYDMIYIGTNKLSTDATMKFINSTATPTVAPSGSYTLDLSQRKSVQGQGKGTKNTDNSITYSGGTINKSRFPLPSSIGNGETVEVKVKIQFNSSQDSSVRFYLTNDSNDVCSTEIYSIAYSNSNIREVTFELTANANATGIMLASSSYTTYFKNFRIYEIKISRGGGTPTPTPVAEGDYIYAHTGPMVEVGTTYAIMYGWLDAGNNAYEKYFVYSGNDLTEAAMEKLIEYADNGAPLVFADGFFTDESATTPIAAIDRNSYVYKLQASVSNKIYEGALGSSTYHLEVKDKLQAALNKSRRVELLNLETPKLYDESKSDAEKYINNADGTGNRTLYFKFTLKAPATKTYTLALYVDINGDGKFASDENIGVTVKKNGVNTTTLTGGNTYTVSRPVQDRVGSVSWKLDIMEGSVVHASVSGVSAIKATAAETVSLRVLQIVHSVDSKITVKLPQAGEVTDDTVIGEPKDIGDVTKLFHYYTKNLNGMDLEFVRMTEAEILTKLNSNEKYLLEGLSDADPGFDMLILGFADCYVGVTDDKLYNALKAFIDEGRAVLFTHDNSSLIGTGGWGQAFTNRFRDLFGMDRYDVLSYRGMADQMRADYPRLQKDSGSPDDSMVTKNGHLLTQGITNGTIYRYVEHGGGNVLAYRATQVNTGAITQYPYTIPETISTAATHPQYYQLDYTEDDIVVWYCLQHKDGETNDNIINYYSTTPNDVRNNYYIYNIKNVTYSGVGHNGVLTRDEIRLFVNTFVAAYRATAKPVEILVQNNDATKLAGGDKYYLCVDVDNSSAGEALSNADIVDGYWLQKADGTGYESGITGYVLDEMKTGQAKRVYFSIKNNNLYGDVDFFLTFYVNDEAHTTATPLAVFRKSDDAFIDQKTLATSLNESDVYYVDVPLTLETTTDPETGVVKHAIITTELDIEIVMRYGDEDEKTPTTYTEVDIMPRGLFNLD